jgi:hypothetical protein
MAVPYPAPPPVGSIVFGPTHNPPLHFNNEQSEEIFVKNAAGGVKADGAKPRPTLMFRSMPKAIAAVLKVLEDGAKKYSADNWKKVEPERYDDANLRHVLAYLSGECYDRDTDSHHLAHAICCLLFRLELDLSKENPT